MESSSEVKEIQRGHCVKLEKESLDFVGISKMLGMPDPWDVYSEELQKGSGTRENFIGGRKAGQNGTSKGLILFGFSISSLGLNPPFWNNNMFCAILLKYVICFLTFRGFTVRKLS